MTSSFTSIDQFSTQDFDALFKKAAQIEANPQAFLKHCHGKMMALVFTEPSTRTYNSFSAAMQGLGGGLVGFNGGSGTSIEKGESLEDTARTMEAYADVMVMRQSQPGFMQKVTDLLDIPVINAGDGTGEHPTQTLLDLYTIHKNLGKLDIKIGFYGDLKNGRTVHSLMKALTKCGASFKCIAPEGLQMPEKYVEDARAAGCTVDVTDQLETSLNDLDVIYTSRLRKEYLPEGDTLGFAPITPSVMTHLNKNALLMEPLPRVGQIDEAVDADPRAKYFEQVKNSIPVRKAIVLDALGIAL